MNGRQVCVDIYSDPNHCGRCGNKLTGQNQVCDTGKPYNWPTAFKACPKNSEWRPDRHGWLASSGKSGGKVCDAVIN